MTKYELMWLCIKDRYTFSILIPVLGDFANISPHTHTYTHRKRKNCVTNEGILFRCVFIYASDLELFFRIWNTHTNILYTVWIFVEGSFVGISINGNMNIIMSKWDFFVRLKDYIEERGRKLMIVLLRRTNFKFYDLINSDLAMTIPWISFILTMGV